MYQLIRKKLADDAILWRYLDLPKYISLLCQSSLWLARTDTFKDKMEGVLYESMRQDLENLYANMNSQESLGSIDNVGDFQNYLSNNTFINCWHQNQNENPVMWEVYGRSENSVAIKTTASKLERSFDLEKAKKIAVETALDVVSYEDHEKASLEKNYRKPFFIKRRHFEFEQEVRLYMRLRDRQSRSNPPPGVELSVDLNILLEEIYVHPDADDWFHKAVVDVSSKYGVKALVKRGASGNSVFPLN